MTGTARIDTQGSLTTTNNSLDLAIEGSGYFQVEMPDGTIGYTRAGNFSLSSEGVVVTSDGLPLQPQIQVPEGASSLTIGTDGTVSATMAGDSAPTELGRIETARFINPAGLEAQGNNIYKETAASGQPPVGAAGLEGRGTNRQGALEGSNANVVEALFDTIETQHASEVNRQRPKVRR